ANGVPTAYSRDRLHLFELADQLLDPRAIRRQLWGQHDQPSAADDLVGCRVRDDPARIVDVAKRGAAARPQERTGDVCPAALLDADVVAARDAAAGLEQVLDDHLGARAGDRANRHLRVRARGSDQPVCPEADEPFTVAVLDDL